MAVFLAIIFSIFVLSTKIRISETALQDFHISTANKSTPSAFSDVVGAMTWQEASLVSETLLATNKVPIISLTPEIMPKNELHVVSMFKWPKLNLCKETNQFTLPASSLGDKKLPKTPFFYSFNSSMLQEVLGFNTAARYWQYPWIYYFVPLDASYENMVEQIYSYNFDAAVGDIEIISNRNQYVEFSQPYIESKLVKVKIAVAATSIFEQFVKVIHDVNRNITYIGGFSVQVFESAVRYLQYSLIYNLVPFYGSYDEMIKEVSSNKFDAAIGDIPITANRNHPLEFSQPYIESNLVIVTTKTKPNIWRQSWMFLKPFSRRMWFLLVALNVFTCFVVWILERKVSSDSCSLKDKQIGTSLWSTFSAFMFAYGEPIRGQWSRFVLAPWLFLVLIVTSIYTANLSSILTNPLLEAPKIDVGLLKRTNASLGCDGNSFTVWYLKEILGLNSDNIKTISSKDEYANSLSNGSIRAAFMLSPQARVFVSEYCKFAISGPTFKLSGFGYVFPKGSALASDISEAILYLRQSGELQQLEEEKLSNSKCMTLESDSESEGLGVAPFAGLFIISGSVSVVALIAAAIRQIQTCWEKFRFIQTMWICKGLWLCLATFFTPNKVRDEIELSIESCNSRHRISNTCHGEELIIN